MKHIALATISAALTALAVPAHAESLPGAYYVVPDPGHMVHGSNQYAYRVEFPTGSISIRFEQGGGSYPLKGRLMSAAADAGPYAGRGSGAILWEVRNTGRTCGLYDNSLRLTIYEGMIFDEASGTVVLGHLYAGSTPTGFTVIPGRPNGPASEPNGQIADSCAAHGHRLFRKG